MRLTETRIRQIVRGILRESDEPDESTAMQLLGGGQLKGKLEGVVNVFVRKLASDVAETPEAQELLSSYSGPDFGDGTNPDTGEVSDTKARVFMASDDMYFVVTEYMRKRKITQILHKIISRVAPDVADILPHHDLENAVASIVSDQILEIPADAGHLGGNFWGPNRYPNDTVLMQSLLAMIDVAARAHANSQIDPERAQIARERDARWWSEQDT
jgi:hypothetical protein